MAKIQSKNSTVRSIEMAPAEVSNPYWRGEYGQTSPLDSFEKYRGAVRSLSLSPGVKFTASEKVHLSRLGETLGSIAPYEPSDAMAIRGIYAEQAAAGAGKLWWVVEQTRRAAQDEHQRQKDFVLGRIKAQQTAAITDARYCLHDFLQQREYTSFTAAEQRLQEAQHAYSEATPEGSAVMREQLERVIEHETGLKCQCSSSDAVAFETFVENARAELRDREDRRVRSETVRAAEMRAENMVSHLFDQAKRRSDLSQSLQALQGSQPEEPFRHDLVRRLTVLYACPTFSDKDQARETLGPEGERMWLAAHDGRQPGPTLSSDGTIDPIEAEHWLGLPNRPLTEQRAWKEVFKQANQETWSTEGLDPVSTRIQAIRERGEDLSSNQLALLDQALEQADVAREMNDTCQTVEGLNLNDHKDRVRLWRALDYDFVERAEARGDEYLEAVSHGLFLAKAAWNSQEVAYFRVGGAAATNLALGSGRAIWHITQGAFDSLQASFHAVVALAKAQEQAAAGDALSSATNVWEGATGLGKAAMAPGQAVANVAKLTAETTKKLRELPHEVRRNMGRSMELHKAREQVRRHQAEIASKHARDGAEFCHALVQDFQRAADLALEAATEPDNRMRSAKKAELEASRNLLEAHQLRLREEWPEIGAVLRNHQFLGLEQMFRSLDEIERTTPPRYRNVFAHPQEVGLRVPMLKDRDGRLVPGSDHGDAQGVIDLGESNSGETLAAVVAGGAIRFSAVRIPDGNPSEASSQELGQIPLGEWDQLQEKWGHMVRSGRSPQQEYPFEYSENSKDSGRNRQTWDTFRRIQAMIPKDCQIQALSQLDRLASRLGGSLEAFTATNPAHRDAQNSINKLVRSGSSEALGVANQPEAELRLQMKSTNGLLSLIQRKTPLELHAFFDRMILDYHGDLAAEQLDALAANDEAFGW